MNICNKIKTNNILSNYHLVNKSISIRSYYNSKPINSLYNNSNKRDNNSSINNINNDDDDDEDYNFQIVEKEEKGSEKVYKKRYGQKRQFEDSAYKRIDQFALQLGSSRVKVSNSYKGFDPIQNMLLGKDMLLNLGSEYEKKINSIEDRSQEVMNAYYNILGNDQSKFIGTFFFYGTESPEYNIWDIVESYFGEKLVNRDSLPERIVIIHCRRNNFSFYEKYNIDGSRNFVKKSLNQFNSEFDNSLHKLPLYTSEYLYSSPNVDNLTFVIIPAYNLNLKPHENELNDRDITHLYNISQGNRYLFPILKSSFFRDFNLTKALDRLSLYTNPIFSVTNPEAKKVLSDLNPRSDDALYIDTKNLKSFKDILRNRIYKVFFRNNSNYLKSVITERFKNSKTLFLNANSRTLKINTTLKKYSSIWTMDSIGLKLTLEKYIENVLNQFFFEQVNGNYDILIQIGTETFKKSLYTKKVEEFKSSYDPEKVNITSYLSKINRIFEADNESESSAGKLAIDFKNEWLFTTQNLRSQEYTKLYKDNYIKLFSKSLDQIKEVDGTPVESSYNQFYILWNLFYKRVLSQLLTNEMIINLPNNILDETIKIITDREGHPSFILSVLSQDFKKNINSEFIEQLVSKEFNPSVSFEEFRDILLEDFASDDGKEIKIEGFSNKWNHIYFRALSRKLSKEIINNSMSNIIFPFFCDVKRFTTIGFNKEKITEIYDKNFEHLIKYSTILKDSLGFKSKKELKEEREREREEKERKEENISTNNQQE